LLEGKKKPEQMREKLYLIPAEKSVALAQLFANDVWFISYVLSLRCSLAARRAFATASTVSVSPLRVWRVTSPTAAAAIAGKSDAQQRAKIENNNIM
jgi:hypothetical protein